jgi:hypothetical protein
MLDRRMLFRAFRPLKLRKKSIKSQPPTEAQRSGGTCCSPSETLSPKLQYDVCNILGIKVTTPMLSSFARDSRPPYRGRNPWSAGKPHVGRKRPLRDCRDSIPSRKVAHLCSMTILVDAVPPYFRISVCCRSASPGWSIRNKPLPEG